MSAIVSELSTAAAGTSNHRYPSLDFVSNTSPHDEYELIQRIGSGTYGDVYKVSESIVHSPRLDGFFFSSLLKARHIPSASMRALKVIKLEAGKHLT